MTWTLSLRGETPAVEIHLGDGEHALLQVEGQAVGGEDSEYFFYYNFVCTGRVPDPTSLFLPTSFCM
jgi:hypothetical protein